MADPVPVILILADAIDQLLNIDIRPFLPVAPVRAISGTVAFLDPEILLSSLSLRVLGGSGALSGRRPAILVFGGVCSLRDHLELELVALEQALEAAPLEVVWAQDLGVVPEVEALLADQVRARQLLQSAVQRVLLAEVGQGLLAAAVERVRRHDLPVPDLVVADIAAEIADWRVVRRDGFDLQGGDQEDVVLWALRLRDIVALLSCLLVEYVLDSFGLSNVEVAFGGDIDDLGAHVAALAELDLGWAQGGVHVEVDEAPVLQRAVETNDAADVSWKLLAALSRGQVRVLVLPIKLDYEVAIVHVCLWVLVRELIAKELG